VTIVSEIIRLAKFLASVAVSLFSVVVIFLVWFGCYPFATIKQLIANAMNRIPVIMTKAVSNFELLILFFGLVWFVLSRWRCNQHRKSFHFVDIFLSTS
jgi:hypothetical protein